MPDYPYLNSDALRSRQAIAAHFLRAHRCFRILEIGGGKNPTTGYFHDGDRVVTVVDPDVPPWNPCDDPPHGYLVRHVAQRIEDYEPPWAPDGLCLLGFLGWKHLDRACIMRYVREARTVVVEAARNHEPAQASIKDLIEHSGKRAIAHIVLDCRGDDIPRDCSFTLRELFVLRGIEKKGV